MTVAEYLYRMLMKRFGGMTEAFLVGVHLKRIYKVVYLRVRLKHEFNRFSVDLSKMMCIYSYSFFLETRVKRIYRVVSFRQRLKHEFILVQCCLCDIICIYSYSFFLDPCKTHFTMPSI